MDRPDISAATVRVLRAGFVYWIDGDAVGRSNVRLGGYLVVNAALIEQFHLPWFVSKADEHGCQHDVTFPGQIWGVVLPY